MRCDELYDRLTELAEGTLQGDVCADVERHLAECRDCQAVRQDLEDLARLCRQVSASAVAQTMPAEVRERITEILARDAFGPRRPAV